jgi:hypothetical protein
MINLLTATRDGRLAVVELKADEDIRLPMQGLDYWSRVAWHHERGEFQRFGYFPGRELLSTPCMFIPPPIHCCDISRRKLSGRWSASTSTGGTE